MADGVQRVVPEDRRRNTVIDKPQTPPVASEATPGARRRFSREFKIAAVREVDSGTRLSHVAARLGIDARMLRRWRQHLRQDPDGAFPGHGRVRADVRELNRLRAEVRALRVERDRLQAMLTGRPGGASSRPQDGWSERTVSVPPVSHLAG